MQRDSKKQPRGRSRLVAGLVAGIVVLWLVWWQWDNIRTVFESDETAQPASVETVVDETEPSPPVDSVAAKPSAAASGWPGNPSVPGDCAQVEAELHRSRLTPVYTGPGSRRPTT